MSSSGSVLILDDETEFAQFVFKVAEGLHYEARVTHSSKEFKAAYARAKPDTIVLDIVMPEEDGIEVVKWLVSQGYDGRVIIVSGYSPHYLRMARILGEMNGLMIITQLEKPVKLADLRDALQKAT
jgi:CheY-like chemotaxis protein